MSNCWALEKLKRKLKISNLEFDKNSMYFYTTNFYLDGEELEEFVCNLKDLKEDLEDKQYKEICKFYAIKE